VCIALKASDGMTRGGAVALCKRIKQDHRIGGCRKVVTPLADGSYAIVIDNTITTKIRQIAIYSEQEWQQWSTHLIESDLFLSSDQTGRRRLQAILKKAGSR
jgi:hypothetical protein